MRVEQTTSSLSTFSNTSSSSIPPTIVNYTSEKNTGIQPTRLTRHAIHYIVRGECYIYDADRSLHASKGDILFLDEGYHHIEQIVESGSAFEQIIIYIDSSALHHIITTLGSNFDLSVRNTHSCVNCQRVSSIVDTPQGSLRNYFSNLTTYTKQDDFRHDHASEIIKLSELIYIILRGSDGCLKSKLIASIDTTKATFQQVIHNHILKDTSVEELASKCNRSMTSFKKEFKRIYELPPHQWFLRQRLNHSRLLLISTKKSIAEVGVESTFPNTSHFIKLFRKFYGTTPAIYRQEYEKNYNG
ncbi:MAG: AraC family transcriptional regulator [Rikenellaceae bacterium]